MNKYQKYVYETLKKHKIILTKEEKENIEIADFGLNQFERYGLGIITYVNNEIYCAKELVMLPNQICPEHRHPPFNNYPGKMETFRVRQGQVELYVDSQPYNENSKTNGNYNCINKIVLNPGEQYTIMPNTRHWFKALDKGAIISEFSSSNFDEYDIFTDPKIKRV